MNVKRVSFKNERRESTSCDAAVRQEFLEHFEAHSLHIPSEERKVRVISDIDDALHASLHDPVFTGGSLSAPSAGRTSRSKS